MELFGHASRTFRSEYFLHQSFRVIVCLSLIFLTILISHSGLGLVREATSVDAYEVFKLVLESLPLHDALTVSILVMVNQLSFLPWSHYAKIVKPLFVSMLFVSVRVENLLFCFLLEERSVALNHGAILGDV